MVLGTSLKLIKVINVEKTAEAERLSAERVQQINKNILYDAE